MLPFYGYVVDEKEVVGSILKKGDSVSVAMDDKIPVSTLPFVKKVADHYEVTTGGICHAVVPLQFIEEKEFPTVVAGYGETNVVYYIVHKDSFGNLDIEQGTTTVDAFRTLVKEMRTKQEVFLYCSSYIAGDVIDTYQSTGFMKDWGVNLVDQTLECSGTVHSWAQCRFNMHNLMSPAVSVSIYVHMVYNKALPLLLVKVYTQCTAFIDEAKRNEGCILLPHYTEGLYEMSIHLNTLTSLVRKLNNECIGFYISLSTKVLEERSYAVTRLLKLQQHYHNVELFSKESNFSCKDWLNYKASMNEQYRAYGPDTLDELLFEINEKEMLYDNNSEDR